MNHAIRAYLRKEKIYLQALSLVVKNGISSVRTPDGPVSIFEVKEDIKIIGQAILDQFKYCGQVESIPKDEPMLEAMGVKTWGMLEKSSKYVSVLLAENKATFTPYKYVGKRDKNYDILYQKALTSDLTPENLGKALLDASVLCE